MIIHSCTITLRIIMIIQLPNSCCDRVLESGEGFGLRGVQSQYIYIYIYL